MGSTMACLEPPLSTPLLPKSMSAAADPDGCPATSIHQSPPGGDPPPRLLRSTTPVPGGGGGGGGVGGSSYKPLAVLPGHVGTVSSLALCGEFVLSASQGKDIIVWQQPDLRKFAKFGQGEGSVKALVAVGSRVFSAHQDCRIRVWKVSRSSESGFRLVATLPTRRDYLLKCMRQSNYVPTRRHHRRLWIEHGDSISCLAAHGGAVYSGSWDRTLKVWRASDFRCLESIRAHDDAINGLVAHKGFVYSASADGKIKAWGRGKTSHCLKGILGGQRDVSWNAVVLCDDGRLVYGGGSDGRVMGWRVEAAAGGGGPVWRQVCDVRAHEMSVLCLCPMGGFLCTGSADKSIGVWRREAGGGLLRAGAMWGHEGPVKCLQASGKRVGEGFLLYSGGLDKSLRVWWVPEDYDEGKCSGEEGPLVV